MSDSDEYTDRVQQPATQTAAVIELTNSASSPSRSKTSFAPIAPAAASPPRSALERCEVGSADASSSELRLRDRRITEDSPSPPPLDLWLPSPARTGIGVIAGALEARTPTCRRNLTLAVGIILMICGGTPYMLSFDLSRYGAAFTSRFGFSEGDTIMIETCTHVGLYLGLSQGIFYDRFGEKKGCLLAGVLLFFGYFGIFLAGANPESSPAFIGFCLFLVGQGSHGFYTAAAMTNVTNWPSRHQGKVMGLLAASFAFSSAVFAPVGGAFGMRKSSSAAEPVNTTFDGSGNYADDDAIYNDNNGGGGEAIAPSNNAFRLSCNGSFGGDRSSSNTSAAPFGPGPRPREFGYFMFVAILFACVSVVGALLIKKDPAHGGKARDKQSSSSSNVELTEALIVNESSSEDEENNYDGMALQSINTHASDSATDSGSCNGRLNTSTGSIRSSSSGGGGGGGGELDIWGWDLAKNKNFWLLFGSMAIEDGSAVLYANALGSMHDALEAGGMVGTIPAISTLVILFSTSNAIGRLSWGWLSDQFPQNRAGVLLCTMVGMAASHLLLALGPAHLLPATLLIGFNFGGMFACAPVITAERFGHKHFGTNWGCVVIAAALGSVFFGAVYSFNYKAATPHGCSKCSGTECYQKTFMVTTAFLMVGVLLNTQLARSKPPLLPPETEL